MIHYYVPLPYDVGHAILPVGPYTPACEYPDVEYLFNLPGRIVEFIEDESRQCIVCLDLARQHKQSKEGNR